MTTRMKRYGLLGLIVMLVDRLTKLEALLCCMERFKVNSLLAFEVGYNRGITWGFFYSQSSLVFTFVTVLIMAITTGVIWYAYDQYKLNQPIIGETLVIAGSLSNIFDRFWYGGVVDFIELSYGNWIWPSFNVADVAIVGGVLIMLISHIKKGN